MTEASVAVALSILAITVSGAQLLMSRGVEPAAEPPRILIYDREAVSTQIEPYVTAGLKPMDVIHQAIDAATARGLIVLDSSSNVKGPPGAEFVLADFVAVPPSEVE